MNVRRRDDSPARGQASARSRAARDLVAWALAVAGAVTVLAVGAALGDGALHVAALFAVLATAGLWWGSGHAPVLLAAARPATSRDAPALQPSLRALAERSGVRAPRLDLSPAREPLVFTTGRSTRAAQITLSCGLLALLDGDELHAVLAREVARTDCEGTFAATFALLVAVATVLAVRVVAGRRDRIPRAVLFPVRVVARACRVSDADVDSHTVRLLGRGDALARALTKIETVQRATRPASMSTIARALAVSGRPGPTSDARVTRLQQVPRPYSATPPCTRLHRRTRSSAPRAGRSRG